VNAVAELAVPTVAVIDGGAIGAGLELALACDLRIASDRVRIGTPEVGWERIPSAGGTQHLVRAVGPTAALRLLLLGEILSAGEALELGLVHRTAPSSKISALAEPLVAELCAAAPIAAAYTKEATRMAMDVPLPQGLRLEADLAALLQTTADRAEGLAAFLSRGTPRFDGR
jgi:enoyl-CoA hydratase